MNTSIPGQNVQSHPASVDAYLKHGWHLTAIPYGTKGPTHRNWNRKENSLQRASDLPPQAGIGLCHAYSGTMALDIDDWDKATTELALNGFDLQTAYNAPDAVIIDSGNPGHGKLLYQMPFGLTLPSKKLLASNPDGTRSNYLDFRCSTANGLTVQDVLPPSIHPKTQQAYRWAGKGHWTRLPLIPPPLLAFWQSLLSQDKERTISAGQDLDASWEDIRSALDHISPDIDRESWIAIGMALHWAGTQTDRVDEAFHLWDEWSAGTNENPATKYQSSQDLLNSWRGFTPDSGRTVGTLFHLARESGWARSLPSADEIFKEVKTDTMKESEIPEPFDIMNGLRPPAPSPDLSLFPPLLATRAQEIAQSVGCDPLVPLWAGLGAVCAAVNAESRLQLKDGFLVPPLLWLMTIGEPADKKTPGSAPMLDELYEIEKEARPAYRQEHLLWEAQEAAYKAARQDYLERMQTPEALLANDAFEPLPELPAEPVPLKLTCSDITSQKLVRNASARPEGLLCYLDEMSSWATKLSDPRSGEDRSAWVVCFESRRYEMERVGSGSIYADNLAISIYGNIQPKILRAHMNPLSRDGLLQRFLPAILRPSMTNLGEPVPECFSHKQQWGQLLRLLHSMPKHTYTLSQEASEKFLAFQKWYIQTQREERIIRVDEDYQAAFGKLEGQCGRLALLFHLIEAPTEFQVSGDCMGRVISVFQNYIVPALRYMYGEIGAQTTAKGTVVQSLDEWVVSHIIALSGVEETVTLSSLKRSARRRLGDVDVWQQDQMVREAMGLLEACHWVKIVEDVPSRKHTVWVINPQLQHTFKEYRQKVIDIKQERLDRNRKIVFKGGKYTPRRTVPGHEEPED